jgi:hypothetical protein
MIELYLMIGLIYSSFLIFHSYTSSRRKNREHWAGILLIGTFLWPIDLIVGNLGMVHNDTIRKVKKRFS